MTFIPNLRTSDITGPASTFPYIDSLFDYGAFLAASPDRIGTLETPGQIAIIGAGLSGLIAAYELLRAGATNPIVIYEASARAGGRTYSEVFDPSQPAYLAELGAMRFPPSEFGLFHYLNKFGIPFEGAFPDPGKVTTDIGYQGKTYTWEAGQNPPSIFTNVNKGWDAFVTDGFKTESGNQLIAPATITEYLLGGNIAAATAAWQAYVDFFENSSFYDGLVTMFTGPNPPGGSSWALPDDFQLFAALGLGSGGFGPLYPISFLEIVRLIVDELETNQQFVPAGIQSLTDAILAQEFNGTTIASRVILNSVVTGITTTKSQVLVTAADGTRSYERAIVATSNRSAQISAGLTASGTFLTPQQSTAINNVHMTASSKVFVMTSSKFWLLNEGLPANIQTDTLVRGVYCLDYTPGDTTLPGVVLLSYTWEDDALKLQSITDPKARVQRLVADLAQTNPEFASYVVPINGDYDTYTAQVDWDMEPYYYGAFKLNFPGADALSQQLFFQFQSAGTAQDPLLYLAGDSASFTGGWTEGAIQTGLNAACAVIRSLGGKFIPSTNPIDNMPAGAYNYYPTAPEAEDPSPQEPVAASYTRWLQREVLSIITE
jgi:tryptophan 2-monooxygenase